MRRAILLLVDVFATLCFVLLASPQADRTESASPLSDVMAADYLFRIPAGADDSVLRDASRLPRLTIQEDGSLLLDESAITLGDLADALNRLAESTDPGGKARVLVHFVLPQGFQDVMGLLYANGVTAAFAVLPTEQ